MFYLSRLPPVILSWIFILFGPFIGCDKDKDKIEKQIQNECNSTAKKAHVEFSQNLLQPNLNALNSFLESGENSTKNMSPIILIFVDALRVDYAKQLLENFQKHVKPEDGWITFDESRSPATTTETSYYALHYSQLGFFRNWTIKNDWKLGSPFLQVLKKAGYELNSWGTPWYGCFESDKYLYSDEYEIMYSGAVGQQLTYGVNPKKLLNNCFMQKPGIPLNLKQVPNYISLMNNGTYEAVSSPASSTIALFQNYEDEKHKFRFQHQAYLDYFAVDTFLDKINTNGPDRAAYYFLHLYSSHAAFAWPEFGIPNKAWNKFTDAERFNRFKPNIPWNADQNFYSSLPSTDEDFNAVKNKVINSYKNSIAFLDFNLNRIISDLKDKGIYDESIIAVVSDHGEKIFEGDLNINNGKVGQPLAKVAHCCLPSYNNTATPLFMKIPKKLKGNSRYQQDHFKMGTLYDVFPTIMDLIDYNRREELQGLSVGNSVFDNKTVCNITTNRKNNIFNISDGKRSIYLELDNDPEKAQGVYMYRETTNGPKYSILKMFSGKAGQNKLEPTIQDPNFSPCFDVMFGENATNNVKYCVDKNQ